MSTVLATASKCALIVVLSLSCCAITGCPESDFDLASESKLPESLSLPTGLTREEVSVKLFCYIPIRGADTSFVLTDLKGKSLAKVNGKATALSSSTYYKVVTEKGTTEIIKLRPYKDHENMERNGRAVALFYVIDDPSQRSELLSAGPRRQN